MTSGEFAVDAVDDFRRSDLDATTLFHYPFRAADWYGSEIASRLRATAGLLLKGQFARPAGYPSE